MELDKRIAKDKTYIDCFKTELAKKFIGKECYLSNDVTSFANINNLYKAVLKEVDEEAVNPYTLENTRWRHSSNFILPCEWVKEPETPKFMPYTLDTWEQDFKPGDTVVFRDKEDATEYKFVYSGYIKHPNNLISVSFGPYLYTFYDLFNSYEIYRNGNWEPFGKESEE